jgi:hypothetical protein
MDTVVDPDALRQKIAWRVLPFVILLYFVAYLDRANVGFAKLAMSKDLKSSGFTEEVFGLGLGIFFIGYLFLEIPRGTPRRAVERPKVVCADPDLMGVRFGTHGVCEDADAVLLRAVFARGGGGGIFFRD